MSENTGSHNRLPRMAAALMPREIGTWSLGALALGALEGGLLGVIVKNQFSESIEGPVLNICVALVVSAPAYSNLTSFLFAALAAGRDKIELLTRLMQLIAVCLVLMSVPLMGVTGLVTFCLFTVIARIAWTGILTIRAAVWRANYQRRWRGQVTARLVQLSSLLIAGFSALIGFLLDWHDSSFRLGFPVAAAAMFAATMVYRGSPMRRRQMLIRSELSESQLGDSRLGLGRFTRVLREDRNFRNYMACMMIFGSGNLMVLPILVIALNEQFNLSKLAQVMLTSSIPLVCLCLTIRPWARLLDGNHIFAYRSIQSWFYVLSIGVFMLAAGLGQAWLLWTGAVLLGVSNAGGHLGWNLGHNDFSTDKHASLYMAIHVTLTGMRGLVAPLIGVAFYQFMSGLNPLANRWAMGLPLLLSVTGAAWFVHLARTNRDSQE